MTAQSVAAEAGPAAPDSEGATSLTFSSGRTKNYNRGIGWEIVHLAIALLFSNVQARVKRDDDRLLQGDSNDSLDVQL
jgi:hypothetical protein